MFVLGGYWKIGATEKWRFGIQKREGLNDGDYRVGKADMFLNLKKNKWSRVDQEKVRVMGWAHLGGR